MSLKTSIQEVFQLKKHGGMIMWRDDNTLIMSDVGKVTHEQYSTIHSFFPHVQIDFLSSEASMSGFIVVFHCNTNTVQRYYLSYARILLHFILVIFGITYYVRQHYHRDFKADEKAHVLSGFY